jgi:hypothetical protein
MQEGFNDNKIHVMKYELRQSYEYFKMYEISRIVIHFYEFRLALNSV